jgi:hypothetical protein
MLSRNFGLCLILAVVLSPVPCYGGADVITNGGFENGTDGWMDRSCSISAVESPVHSGSGSAHVFGRTEEWQGIRQPVLGKMQDGKTYQISGWVRLEDANSSPVVVSVEQADDGGTNYINVGRATATNSEWVELSGEFTLNVDGELLTLDVYFEGPQPGVSFYVDDVKVLAPDDDKDDDEGKGEDEEDEDDDDGDDD